MTPWRFEDDEDTLASDMLVAFVSTAIEREERREAFRRAPTETLLFMLEASRVRLARMQELELPQFVLDEELWLIEDRVVVLRERGVL